MCATGIDNQVSFDALDPPLMDIDWYLIDILTDIRSTLNWHSIDISINSQLAAGQ